MAFVQDDEEENNDNPCSKHFDYMNSEGGDYKV